MLKTLLSGAALAVLSGLYTPAALAESTVFESKDVLTPAQALGRYQWLEKCYSGLLLEVADNIFDPTTPISNEQKLADLKNVFLYKNGVLKDDAKYLTFGDETNANPKRWYAGTSLNDGCNQIPSDYSVSALLVTPSIKQYCTAQSRTKDYEFIKEVTFSDLTNSSGAEFYSNFVGQAARIYKDRDYQLTLTPGFTGADTYPETWHVFIDWNQDGDFYDASESYNAGVSNQAVNLNITPPPGTVSGLTKMRVTMDYLGGNSDACKEIDSGEIEDYLIYIK
ncbi:GEVED domain-containing protein [Thalassomonas haliotis]|uniref:Collagenase n=1 Tax=Thalassomonas haliotis TaxID=485448 RepID=A0ABY7VIP2_9GAMM|nr:GEVED domain-containing protein [Thalassomonas haliotis]WDE13441.1 collagenase [Thalassomonas haliotis]